MSKNIKLYSCTVSITVCIDLTNHNSVILLVNVWSEFYWRTTAKPNNYKNCEQTIEVQLIYFCVTK